MKQPQQLAQRLLRVFECMSQLIKLKPNSIVESLNLNQVRTLIEIRHHPGIAQKDIAEILQITPASVSIAIRQMEDMGLVERHPDEEDGRVMRLHLSEYGQQIVRETEEMQIAIMQQLLNTLSKEKQEQLITLLEFAIENNPNKRAMDK